MTPARPFSQTGLDFAGPLQLKEGNDVKKIYIAVFVCLTTKAVHRELVSSLTKEDCIFALKRFAARRGTPKKILSDNGKNFIGARNELLQVRALLNSDKKEKSLVQFVNENGIEWVTIPPRSPHFGGLWEAAVKSMKRHLRRVVGLQVLRYEKLLTTLTQFEAILNSRPLHPLTNDPNDNAPLTPSHFLIGGSLLALPEDDIEVTTNIRLKLMQRIQQDFWKSWKRDYLTTLQIRKRWFTNGPEYNVGDLVLIAEDNEAPLQWKTGRIKQIFTGNDGNVRVVKVKTSTGELMRPVVKLRKLPIDAGNAVAPQQRS